MANPDLIVVGAGISGLAYAWTAARAGKKVLVLEKQQRIGGCIFSYRYDDGYWYELGAHTVYNSYASLLNIAENTGLTGKIIQRGPARVHFGLLKQGTIDWLTPPRILLRLNWLEVALHAPFGFFRGKSNRTLKEYYGAFLGPGNFNRILSPFFAAVPSQCADGFPAEGPGSLFKKRVRRKEYPKSFGFAGGLQALCDAIAAHPNIELKMSGKAVALSPSSSGFEVYLEHGDPVRGRAAAIAVPHGEAVEILEASYPALSQAIRGIETSKLESMGMRIPRSKCKLPDCAFIVPADDVYFSAVSRDPFPDPDWRAFAFHFRPGTTLNQKLERICRLLQVAPDDLDTLSGQNLLLPSPRIDHAETVLEIEQSLEDTGLALVGNYFNGLAIEDCIKRALKEWHRLKLQ